VNAVARHRSLVIAASLMLALGLAACAHQPPATSYDPPGFLLALLHGYLIFFSVIGSIFLDIRIYAFPNSGFWYDIGYVIGVLGALFTILLAF